MCPTKSLPLTPALRKPTSSSQAFVQLSPELNFSSLFSLPFQHLWFPTRPFPALQEACPEQCRFLVSHSLATQLAEVGVRPCSVLRPVLFCRLCSPCRSMSPCCRCLCLNRRCPQEFFRRDRKSESDSGAPKEARLHLPSLEQAHGRAVHGLGWLVLCFGKCAELIEPNRQIQVGGPILVRRPAGSNSPLRFK